MLFQNSVNANFTLTFFELFMLKDILLLRHAQQFTGTESVTESKRLFYQSLSCALCGIPI